MPKRSPTRSPDAPRTLTVAESEQFSPSIELSCASNIIYDAEEYRTRPTTAVTDLSEPEKLSAPVSIPIVSEIQRTDYTADRYRRAEKNQSGSALSPAGYGTQDKSRSGGNAAGDNEQRACKYELVRQEQRYISDRGDPADGRRQTSISGQQRINLRRCLASSHLPIKKPKVLKVRRSLSEPESACSAHCRSLLYDNALSDDDISIKSGLTGGSDCIRLLGSFIKLKALDLSEGLVGIYR